MLTGADFAKETKMKKKITALLLVLSLALAGCGKMNEENRKSDLKFIFVHGLSGWGSYDTIDRFYPYWGLSGGSLMKYLNSEGYESYAASVDPTGSAWDRACELYAQLTGTRVDYGAEHSARCNHERFGRDYSKKPLVKDFNDSEFVLLGHSFGGVTIRLFSEILRNGSEAEIAYTDESDLSDFFKSGGGKGLKAIVTLAAPTNGTTAYDLYEDDSFDLAGIEIPEKYAKLGGTVSAGTKPDEDGRIKDDYASYDMHIDNALELNDRITTFDDVYYFAVPCSSSIVGEDGALIPDESITEPIFMQGAIYMTKYTGYTAGGMYIDETWQANDGLVNTVSAGAPIGHRSEEYVSGSELSPGIWYVMPTIRGDHMSLQGGLTKHTNIRSFYIELTEMITGVYEKPLSINCPK